MQWLWGLILLFLASLLAMSAAGEYARLNADHLKHKERVK